MASQITMQIKSLDKLVGQINGIQQKGETAMRRTVSDMKSRLPGPIATVVGRYYKIDKSEINPKKIETAKQAADIKVEGKTVSTLSLVYEGRVLTPAGHGFTLREKQAKKGSKVEIAVKKGGKAKQLKGEYNTVFMAGTSKASSTRIPFQRIPTTGAIEAIRTVAVPEMITNEEVDAAIHERIDSIVDSRIRNNFKDIIK